MPNDLGWTPPVTLQNAEACMRYCLLHHHMFPEIRITDEDDAVVMHVRESQYVYPREEAGVLPEALANIDALFRGERRLSEFIAAQDV